MDNGSRFEIQNPNLLVQPCCGFIQCSGFLKLPLEQSTAWNNIQSTFNEVATISFNRLICNRIATQDDSQQSIPRNTTGKISKTAQEILPEGIQSFE
ncbi:MAG TPA: hypothetical protein PLW21_01715 [Methanothrix sp.]|nr:hypothetical protein [Methanothrix sp.]